MKQSLRRSRQALMKLTPAGSPAEKSLGASVRASSFPYRRASRCRVSIFILFLAELASASLLLTSDCAMKVKTGLAEARPTGA